MTIGEKIKLLRIQSNLTQEELANYANTTKQTIHKYETGIITNIPANKIKAISEKLGTTPAYLMGWETENDKKFYMSLIYDDGDEVYSLRDVEAFRQSYSGTKMFNPAKLRPMTYAELIYMSVYLATVDKFAYVTRYPAIEIGSTVPCKVHIGTTSPSRKVKLINTAFEETISITLPEYPVIGASFVDSTILHPSILKGLGADFDQLVSVTLRRNTYRKIA